MHVIYREDNSPIVTIIYRRIIFPIGGDHAQAGKAYFHGIIEITLSRWTSAMFVTFLDKLDFHVIISNWG